MRVRAASLAYVPYYIMIVGKYAGNFFDVVFRWLASPQTGDFLFVRSGLDVQECYCAVSHSIWYYHQRTTSAVLTNAALLACGVAMAHWTSGR
jgi:hypothetical protein